MAGMWTILLFFALQTAGQVGALPTVPLPTGGLFQIKGRIVVDKGDLPIVDLTMKTDNGELIKKAQTFANGTFRINDVALGRYTIEIIDARYQIMTLPLWLREPEDTDKEFVLRLVLNTAARAAPESAELDRIDLRALEMDPRIPAAAFAEFKKGTEAMRERSSGNPAEAHFKQVTELAPDFYEGWYQFGLEKARQHQGPEAIRAMERALGLRPTARTPLSTLGRLYVEAGDFQKGVDTLVKIGSLGELTADDRYFLGLGFYNLKKPAAAQQQFEMAAALAPSKNPAVYIQLHNTYLQNGNPESALKALDTYMKLFPKDSNFKKVEDIARKLRTSVQKGKP